MPEIDVFDFEVIVRDCNGNDAILHAEHDMGELILGISAAHALPLIPSELRKIVRNKRKHVWILEVECQHAASEEEMGYADLLYATELNVRGSNFNFVKAMLLDL